MQKWKMILWFCICGGLLGALLAAWAGPSLITWWFQPPVNVGVDCSPAIRWGMATQNKFLLIFGTAGVAAGFAAGFALGRRGERGAAD